MTDSHCHGDDSHCHNGDSAIDFEVDGHNPGACVWQQRCYLYYLLPTTYYLLPTTYYLLPTTNDLLPTTYDLLPNTSAGVVTAVRGMVATARPSPIQTTLERKGCCIMIGRL